MSRHKPQHKAPSNKVKYIAVLAAVALLFFCVFVELQGFSRYPAYVAANTQHFIERNGDAPVNPIYETDKYFYMPTHEVVEYLDAEGFSWNKKKKCFEREASEGDQYIQFSSSPIFGKGAIQTEGGLAQKGVDQGIYGVNIVVKGADPALGSDLVAYLNDDAASKITSRYGDPSKPQWCLCGILHREDVDYAFFIYQELQDDGAVCVAFSVCSQIHFEDSFKESIDDSECSMSAYEAIEKNLALQKFSN